MTRPPDRLIHGRVYAVCAPYPAKVDPFRKRSPATAPAYAGWEAAGLRWLAAATASGGARVVDIVEVSGSTLVLDRLASVPATRAAATDFGERLARTHAAGATAYGIGPDGWDGDGYFGPSHAVLDLALGARPIWGIHWARQRLRPIAATCEAAGTLAPGTVADLHRVADRCEAGDFDTDDAPARVHGDLWSGNLMWTERGVVLIDPAAHGGHRELDLAMLALFGAPHLPQIVTAYERVSPLAAGWRDRVHLHQLYALAVHAHLFGSGYAVQTAAAARRYR